MRLLKNIAIPFCALLLSCGLLPMRAQNQVNVDSLIEATMAAAQATADSIMKEMEVIRVSSETPYTRNYSQYGPVVVTRFHVEITLNPDEGYFDVEENYHVLFNVQKHGIYRNIPLVYRLDNAQSGIAKEEGGGSGFWSQKPEKHTIRISNVEVPGHTDKVSGGFFSNMLNIRIGDADKYVQGPEKYTIKYRVKDAFLFDDHASYFYWNLMGDQWGFPFLESTFELHLPNAPKAEYYVYSGQPGSTTSKAEYAYENGIFSGKANEVLGSGRDMTLLLKLPADYIARPTALELWWNEYGWVVFPPLAFLFFFLAWYA